MCGLQTDLTIWMLLLKVVSAKAAVARLDVGAEKAAAVLMGVLSVGRRHPEPAIKVLSNLKWKETYLVNKASRKLREELQLLDGPYVVNPAS